MSTSPLGGPHDAWHSARPGTSPALLSRPLLSRLALAACALVGASPGPPAEAMEVTSSTLVYSETDRVAALETRASLRLEREEGRSLTLNVAIDALSGASPNGAPAAAVPQTFTTPSGLDRYTIAPGVTPLDSTFHDQRVQGSATVAWPLGRLLRGTLGANVSTEHDYTSFGLSTTVARDFFQRNTTLSLGLSGAFDTVNPEGGPPVPLAAMRPPALAQSKTTGNESKRVADVLVGLTQVLDPSTIVQANWSVSRSTGYLNDPYKIVAVVQGESGASPGEPVRYLYESRPDARTKQALYGEAKRAVGVGGRDMLNASYRYLWDDWGTRSHTVEGRYRVAIGAAHALEPQVRFYRQTATDFWTVALVDGEALPEHATGDMRLGAFDAWTTALKWSWRLRAGPTLDTRVGLYRQTGDSHPASAIGSLRDQDLFPTVDALLVQFGATYGW